MSGRFADLANIIRLTRQFAMVRKWGFAGSVYYCQAKERQGPVGENFDNGTISCQTIVFGNIFENLQLLRYN